MLATFFLSCFNKTVWVNEDHFFFFLWKAKKKPTGHFTGFGKVLGERNNVVMQFVNLAVNRVNFIFKQVGMRGLEIALCYFVFLQEKYLS